MKPSLYVKSDHIRWVKRGAFLSRIHPNKEDSTYVAMYTEDQVKELLKDRDRINLLESKYFAPIEGGIRNAIDEQLAIDDFMRKIL